MKTEHNAWLPDGPRRFTTRDLRLAQTIGDEMLARAVNPATLMAAVKEEIARAIFGLRLCFTVGDCRFGLDHLTDTAREQDTDGRESLNQPPNWYLSLVCETHPGMMLDRFAPEWSEQRNDAQMALVVTGRARMYSRGDVFEVLGSHVRRFTGGAAASALKAEETMLAMGGDLKTSFENMGNAYPPTRFDPRARDFGVRYQRDIHRGADLAQSTWLPMSSPPGGYVVPFGR